MIDNLKDLKDIFDKAKNALQMNKEPIEDLLKLNACLKAIVDEPKLIIETVDKDYRKFFFEDMAVGALKRLSLEKSRDEKYLDVIGCIFENYMRLFYALLKLGYYEPNFFDSIRHVFQYDSILNLYNYQIPEEQLKRLRNQNQEWRRDLKVGDMVDAIIDEASQKCSGWSQARIDQVRDDTLHLEFIYDVKTTDRYIDRWSVEIAPFESKTQESFEWRKTLAVGTLVDGYDKTSWNKSTILEIKEQPISEGRTCLLANIGFRVYQEGGSKNDEKGTFEGWSNRFDEWISIFSPRIQPYLSKTLKGSFEDQDLDDQYDHLVKPEDGQDRVFAVPRVRKCTSSLFIKLINLFGSMGGYDLVLECLSKDESSAPQFDGLPMNLNIVGILVSNISNPYLIYHRDFISEYGPKLVDICIQKLRNAPEKSLRDVRRERIESIIKSIDNFQRRLITKEEREKQTEVLKLEVALMCLKSSFLERKIQGIKDLNMVIKNNKIYNFKSISAEYLIEWISSNGVYSIIFDTKNTHTELVQRANDILKLLLFEKKLNLEVLEQFWSLSRVGEYRVEVYKIINEIAQFLGQEHMDFIFKGIKHIAPEKMTLEEFTCMSELGKFSKDADFKKKVTDFFWDIVCNSDNYKEDLVNNCITKFAEMVKYWDMNLKHDFFLKLTNNLANEKSSISSIKLFKNLIKDQKDRFQYNYNTTPTRVAESGGSGNDEININITPAEMTLVQSLKDLIEKEKLPQIILDNLKGYINKSNAKLAGPSTQDRKKAFIVNPKYSHNEEIDERIQFLRYLAQSHVDYQISKSELNILYQLLAIESFVQSDQEEFLTWCKSSCELSTATNQILDLNEVGEFFSEKMNNGSLDVRNLLEVGFDFLQQYFLSVNEKSQKLIKSSNKFAEKKDAKVMQSFTYTGYGYVNNLGGYGPIKPIKGKEEKESDKSVTFNILKHPHELDKLEIVWNIALQCINEPVVKKAIDFLIKVYYNLDNDLSQHKISIQEDFIKRCIDILRNPDSDEHTLNRVILILKSIIIEAEKKGTAGVRPHSSLLKGELLDKIIIKNRASHNIQSITISLYSNTTVWELKTKVSEKLGLAPKYLKLSKGDGTVLKDTQHGLTLGELGIQSHEIMNAEKLQIIEDIPKAPLLGPDGRMTEKVTKIFNEWFDMYSNENDKMTKETCALFIYGCTGEKPTLSDDRIGNLFKAYDKNNDGFIERAEFLEFYLKACKDKEETVRDNMKHHNIRADLKKLSEIQEEVSFQAVDMPRLKISKNEEYFDLLMSLLDKNASVSESSWSLIQMLATSPQIQKRVLELQSAKVDGSDSTIDWSKFFDSNSVYRLLYTLQIVEAVMEEGEGEGLEKVDVLDTSAAQKKTAPPAPPLPGAGILPPGTPQPPPLPSQIVIEELSNTPATTETTTINTSVDNHEQPEPLKRENSEEDKLKANWTKMFLEGNGFQYILKVFMEKQLSPTQLSVNGEKPSLADSFNLKHMAFLLKLLRIFMLAAFSTSEDQAAYAGAAMVRRSSSIHESDPTQQSGTAVAEGSRFKQLQSLLVGPLEVNIINGIDYSAILQRLLNILSQILIKGSSMILEDKLIIENALSLLVGCILHKHELLGTLYAFRSDSIASCEDLILTGLLYTPQEKVREEFKQSLVTLSSRLINTRSEQGVQRPLEYLLKLLSEKFTIISAYPCKQYFELFCELIDQYFLIKNIGGGDVQSGVVFNPEQLLGEIIDKVKEYNKLSKSGNSLQATSSAGQSSEDFESIYIGLLQLTGKIIDNFDIRMTERLVESKNLIDEIFTHFLFASIFQHSQQQSLSSDQEPTQQIVKKVKPKRLYGEVDTSKSSSVLGKPAKDAAYKLLNNLIRKSPILMNQFLSQSMKPLLSLIKRHDGWNYQPPGSAAEGKQKFVGLRNLGCICYMNAMMQQFFMVPAFRYNLLSVDDGQPEETQEYRGKQIDDNMLHQLQKVMASLELSDRNEFNMFDFCFSFKDFEGNPTNTSEQKDAQEFLNMAFDRIENMLRGTSRKYLVQSVFGGQTCSQVVCSECGTCKNRIEDFYNLSLTVKDTKSMADSLQKMIEGEIINGFQCDTCNKKVDISKRTLLSAAPNVLIVHLQRIIFNFNTFRNDKINSFFEFPSHLDLSPYSFYDVMKREGRLDKKAPKEGEEEEDATKPQASSSAGSEDDGQKWPEPEDCWDYKLVGVIVHSGTANAGHYWSYINTRRGHAEPASEDPSWAQTENDTWMEFNDSTVRGWSFDKLKEECYGGDAGGYEGWGWGGSSGKSAYMLVYERREKKPIKVLVDPTQAEDPRQPIHLDEKKDEHYQLLDYRSSVEEIAANRIYQQVAEDNQKFEFDNDIYSQEFFEFVRGILLSVKDSLTQTSDPTLLSSITDSTLALGKKTILDLLAKCFHNTAIKPLSEALGELIRQDAGIAVAFLEGCFKEDDCQYLIDVLLDCTDATARMYVAALVKQVVNKLKQHEREKILLRETVEVRDEKTGEVTTVEQPAALVSRFIMKLLSLLNTQVAKAWSRFDNFLEIIYSFGVGIEEPSAANKSQPSSAQHQSEEKPTDQDTIGLEFLMSVHFVERACDFMLGKKSPLCHPSEKRPEMGGSYTQPNFGHMIKLLTRILTDATLLERHPLNDVEKKLFLHNDLLKVMLGSSVAVKQFGQCLANMCKDNAKMSAKVAKVFLKAISNANYDNVKSYLTALKPFVRLDDGLRGQRLEWIFGISQVVSRRGYKEERFKYGLELVERMNDESHTYLCPLGTAISDDSLLSQLLRCKGKLDNFAINCLKELLSLMAKNEHIARYIYYSAPSTYQMARYTDWIGPYVEYQRQEVEKSNSFVYFKQKYDNILKCIEYLRQFEATHVAKFKQEEQEAMQRAYQQDQQRFTQEVQNDWLAYNHNEVIEHYPPQLIIGKQTQDDRVVLVHSEDPLVTVTLSEVTCEYNFSNPTSNYFNLSIPHIEIKNTNFSTTSYAQWKKNEREEQKRLRLEEEKKKRLEQNVAEGKDPQEEELTTTTIAANEVEEEAPAIVVRDWFTCKREAPILLKVTVTNKSSGKVKAIIRLTHQGALPSNVKLPESELKCVLLKESDTSVLIHLQKVDPTQPWSQVQVHVRSVDLAQPAQPDTVSMVEAGGSNHYLPGSSGLCMECMVLNINNVSGFCSNCMAPIMTPVDFQWYAEQA